MTTTLVRAAAAAAFVAAAVLPAHAHTPVDRSLVTERVGGFTVPVSAASPEQGRFDGQLKIVRFGADHGQLVAVGILTGTLVDENGVASGIVRTVSLPVQRNAARRAPAGTIGTQSHLPCDILNLVLGPLDLDLLGLVVHLDTVVLDIGAVPGAGNLLGNLLCAITGLLDGVGSLAQLIALLNQLLDLLT